MNIHPIFVHFPIALLTLYGILELSRFKKTSVQSHWFYIKAFLVILGSGASFVARQTGEIAKERIGGNIDGAFGRILSQHEMFANITVLVFLIIALCYLIAWVNKRYLSNPQPASFSQKVWYFCSKTSNLVLNSPLVVVLATVGLVVVTITGGLGGMLVFGENADPVFRFIYQTFLR